MKLVPSFLGLLALPQLAFAADEAVAPIAGAAPVATAAVSLSPDLSPWTMFVNADPIVKTVIISLAFASIVTWTIWVAKTLEIVMAKRRARASLKLIIGARGLNEAASRLGSETGAVAEMARVAAEERQLSDGGEDGMIERIHLCLARIEGAYRRSAQSGIGILATIGATAPFVGLFGTVWGIMNSFVGIARTQTTNLAVVAPGIAEALLATAAGLVAAIPAVIIYNWFARSIAGYRATLGDAATEVQRLASRDLDRFPSAKAAE